MLEFPRPERRPNDLNEKASTMSHSNYLTLIDRGRKAGLSTRDLYTAMSTRPSEGVDEAPGQVDGNGFVPTYTQQGKRVYRPTGGARS
jgi:hypothetical protein